MVVHQSKVIRQGMFNTEQAKRMEISQGMMNQCVIYWSFRMWYFRNTL